MEPFTTHTGLVVPLDRTNVNTDEIIPASLPQIDQTYRLWQCTFCKLAPAIGWITKS